MAAGLATSALALAACEAERPAPATEQTTAAVDGEEISIRSAPVARPEEMAAPMPEEDVGDAESATETDGEDHGADPAPEPTLFNLPDVPSDDVAADRAALTAIPARFLGQWDAVDGPCAPGSDMFMTIRPGTITFYESQGDVAAVRRGRPGIVVTLDMQGEGESWTSRYAMRLVRNSEQLATRVTSGDAKGQTILRRRCPPEGSPSPS
ncbi:hypothetical protein DL238_00655 [Alteriqipengyuania lutimaris]|uniref:Uncharacterized protein n=2 Tax=Alteriqipengyuania lutimaris TaxID=1538146 RepID=A0A395LHZ7_9SPHN|nr:hypothetical protein DL238_00655 [Alteriqipengyuania lutimaris]